MSLRDQLNSLRGEKDGKSEKKEQNAGEKKPEADKIHPQNNENSSDKSDNNVSSNSENNQQGKPLSLMEQMKLRKQQNETTNGPKDISLGFGSVSPSMEKIEAVIPPVRELPQQPAEKDKHEVKTNDGTVDVAELRSHLEYLANNIDQRELVGNIVRTIGIQLRKNPTLTNYMKDPDFDLMVRGLRASYNTVAFNRKQTKEKKTNSSKEVNDLKELMKDAGFGDIDLGLKL